MIIFDAHLDLAMNALNWDRNLDLGVYEVRAAEAGMTAKGRGRGTTTLPEMHKAQVAVCCATVIDRTTRPNSPSTGSASQEISYAKARGQLAFYQVLESQGKVRLLRDWPALERHIASWQQPQQEQPLGFILSMEGADPIVWPEQVANWWQDGLRVVGLSHYGVSAYAHGTGTQGGLTPSGATLLRQMDSLGMILDLSHLADQAFFEALERFHGPVLGSHNCCRALVPGDRQFSDEQLRAIVARSGVIGVAADAWMLYPGFVRDVTPNTVLSMEAIADHIDHICQIAGNSGHAAIGSDLDGGYGTEQTPRDLDTIADLQGIPALLARRGYGTADIDNVMYANWVRLFQRAWKR